MGNFWLFLLQLGVILGFSRLVGAAFRRIGQPQVVGEMAAGFALGPTVFGAIAPNDQPGGFSLRFCKPAGDGNHQPAQSGNDWADKARSTATST